MEPVKILETIFTSKNNDSESRIEDRRKNSNNTRNSYLTPSSEEIDLEANQNVDDILCQLNLRKGTANSNAPEPLFWPPEGPLSNSCIPPLKNEFPNMNNLRPYVFSPRILIPLSTGNNQLIGKDKDGHNIAKNDDPVMSHQHQLIRQMYPNDKVIYREEVNGMKLMMIPTIPLLQPIEHVYFRKLNPKKFDLAEFDLEDAKKAGKCTVLLNTRGRLWLYIKEEYKRELFRVRWSWQLFDVNDQPQYLIKGWQFIFGMKSSMKVYMYQNGDNSKARLIGHVRQDFCGPTYYMSLNLKPPKYKAYGACYSPWTPYCWWCVKERFDIEDATLGTDIGIVTRRWGEEADYKELQSVLGIKFDITVSTRHKLLFISFLLLIWFQFHRNGGNGLPLFIILALLVTLGIGAMILVHFEIGIEFLDKIKFF